MTAKLVKAVGVLEDSPCIIGTLPVGATVVFDTIDDITEVLSDGKLYSAMLQDLLYAAQPMEWISVVESG